MSGQARRGPGSGTLRAVARRGVLEIARRLHAVLPFSQLRTARLFLRINGGEALVVRRGLFGYNIQIETHRSTVHTRLYLEGERLVDDLDVVRSLIHEGATAVDIGANIGYFTYFLSRAVGPEGTVISLEPDAENFRQLQSNVSRNHMTHCRVLNVAAGAEDGVVTLYPGLNAYVQQEADSQPNCILRSLDSILSELNIAAVDFVKVDVEGYEREVLKGMRGCLASERKPVLRVEVHPLGMSAYGNPTEVYALLRRYYHTIRAFRPANPMHGPMMALRVGGVFKAPSIVPFELQEAHVPDNDRFFLLCLP